MEWWSGGVVEWWSGGVVEWWSGGVVEWWRFGGGSVFPQIQGGPQIELEWWSLGVLLLGSQRFGVPQIRF
jgi:hypothetical protein